MGFAAKVSVTRAGALLALAFVSILWTTHTARADDASYTRTSYGENQRSLIPFVRTDLHGVLTWEAEFGAGLRGDILIFDETRMYNGRDEIALSVGCDLSFVTFGGENRVTVWPTLALQWSLSVSERFVFYPELGLVAQIRPQDFEGLYPNVGFGGRVHAYRTLDVLLRLGWPMAVSAGITF
jgi:hypothetical protein